MSRLRWGLTSKVYDEGLDYGVLYSDKAVVWNGLTSVTEEVTGGINTEHYIDGVRRIITEDRGEFEGTIRAYTYPDEFEDYNGFSDRDPNKLFGISYRTARGLGHRTHLIYNARVLNQQKDWTTMSSVSSLSPLEWDISASKVEVPGSRPTAHLMIDTSSFPWVDSIIGDILYGTDSTDARLPNPSELITIFEEATSLRITYLGNGEWSAEGPDPMIQVQTNGEFALVSPSALEEGNGRFQVSSY